MAKATCDEIRTNAAEGDSEEYDLAGFTKEWCEDLVASCLAQVLPAKAYIGCRFVIGGGKKTRQKYDPDMLKNLTQALQGAGYTEDRGASACKECMGMYKYQHDTDKDLKFLHVFPKVEIPSGGGGDGGEGGGEEAGPSSPEYQCVTASFEDFEDLVADKVPSFSQKRALLKRLKVMQAALEALEKKLANMEALTDQEQEMYDSMVDVASKVEYLNKELEAMMEKGRLTKGEQKQMVDDLIKKMEEMDVAIAAADAEGKAKRKDALTAQKEKVKTKADAIAAHKPIVYTMANEKELMDLRKELAALNKLEASGRLLTGAEAAKLAKRGAIEQRIANIEGEDKGWFEDECRALLFTPKPAAPEKKSGGGSTGGGNAPRAPPANVGWMQAAVSKGGARRPPSAGPRRPAGGNPFAMLGDE